MFHLRSAVTKILMNYQQKYILGRSLLKKNTFERLLEQFWNPYNVDFWKVKACFNSLVGGEIRQYTIDY